MKFKIFGNTLKETGRNIIRNPLITIASLTTMTLMLLVLGFFLVFSINANYVTKKVAQTPPLQIWLRDNVTDAEVAEIDQALKKSEFVLEYSKQSPQENYEEFKSRLGDDAALLDSLDPEILPFSFTLKLKSPDMVENFKADFASFSGVDDIQYSEAVRSFLDSASSAVNWFSLIAVIVLFVISLLVISNMTRMSILARADEISIMKYVGATNSYIRVPYLLEGATIGLLGGLLASGILALAYAEFYKFAMQNTLPSDPFAILGLSQFILPLILVLVMVGAVVGALGSGFSVRKYVNV